MKNTLKIAASFLLTCTLAIVGCKKDDPEPSPTEILTAGTCWKMTLLEGFDKTNNVWAAVPIEDCQADDCFSFKTDQTFAVEEGAAKCAPDDPQQSTGTWSLSDDGKKLSLSDSSNTDVGTVVELTKGKLVYETVFDEEKIRITMRAN